ncbi:MAG TPA: hypothetical protein VIG33_02390 [Pseudobdellovibrionaceae bacterium]
MNKAFTLTLLSILIHQTANAGWFVFNNKPKNEKQFIGTCSMGGSFVKFGATMMETDPQGCKVDKENIHSIICMSDGGSSISTWFETQEECNSFRKNLQNKLVKNSSSISKSSAKFGWVFTKLKSSQAFERFKPCEKVNANFEGHLKNESDMWSGRGAVCEASSFYDDHNSVFECKYPNLGDLTRYYFWHESKDKCESRLKMVKEKWKNEKLD